jgi:signal transduction histidine kinase
MESTRWWHAAVVGTAVVLSALVALEQPSTPRLVGVLAVNAALVAFWFAIGRRAMTDRRLGVVLSAAVVALASIGVGFDASMATIQCICFPIIWVVLDRTTAAIVANIVLAVGVGIGMFLGLGGSTDGLVVAVTIEGLSLVFSLSLGLWITRISAQSGERQRLIDQLETAQAKLALLSRDAGTFDERERLAREIHDTIAQDLTGLVLTAQRGLRELRDGNTAAAETQLEVLEENARNALAETRALVASGAAVGVDIGGLATALGRLGERFQRETGIAVTVVADDSAALDRDGEVVLLRCAQEALANVRKHSRAGSARLVLAASEKAISLSIADDGTGFDASARSTGFGLDGMRERLAFVRGELLVTAAPGGGTTLVASVPAIGEATA